MIRHKDPPCPCGSGRSHERCCGPYIRREAAAPTAEALMRSRYTAYTRLDADYLAATWHASTRPDEVALANDVPAKWIGLRVIRCASQGSDAATVEFVARYRINGRAHRMHETSRFVREAGHWFYVDGELHPAGNRQDDPPV
jgi:SEC-C motif domain protein